MKFRPAVVLLVAAFALVTGITSCIKSYTCQCVITYNGVPGLPDTTVNSFTIKDSKNNAKSECSAGSANYTNNTVDPSQGTIATTETCTLY